MLSIRNVKTILFILFLTINTSIAQEINYGLSVGYSRCTPIFDIENNHENIRSENYYNLMAIVEISGNPISRIQSGIHKYIFALYFNIIRVFIMYDGGGRFTFFRRNAGQIAGYFEIVVWAASNILTAPESRWRTRPFSGSIPVQLPVNFLPSNNNVTRWPN